MISHSPGCFVVPNDGFTVTTELHKGKYVYYRCSQCAKHYMREQDISDRLGDVLKGIYVPETIVHGIVESLHKDRECSQAQRQEQMSDLKHRLAALRARMDQMYEDKLDGKIDEEFWTRKMNDWREQERQLQGMLERLSSPQTPENALSAQRILELANKAYSLYFTRNHAERGQLLKTVLLNGATDGVTVTPTYRKPFDLIFQRAKNCATSAEMGQFETGS